MLNPTSTGTSRRRPRLRRRSRRPQDQIEVVVPVPPGPQWPCPRKSNVIDAQPRRSRCWIVELEVRARAGPAVHEEHVRRPIADGAIGELDAAGRLGRRHARKHLARRPSLQARALILLRARTRRPRRASSPDPVPGLRERLFAERPLDFRDLRREHRSPDTQRITGDPVGEDGGAGLQARRACGVSSHRAQAGEPISARSCASEARRKDADATQLLGACPPHSAQPRRASPTLHRRDANPRTGRTPQNPRARPRRPSSRARGATGDGVEHEVEAPAKRASSPRIVPLACRAAVRDSVSGSAWSSARLESVPARGGGGRRLAAGAAEHVGEEDVVGVLRVVRVEAGVLKRAEDRVGEA